MDVQRIENLRKRKNLTQKEFAGSIGFTTTGYQKMIKAGDLKVSVLEAICETFKVNILTFLEKPTEVTNSISEPPASYGKGSKTTAEEERDHYKKLWENTQRANDALVTALNLLDKRPKNLTDERRHTKG